MEYYCECNDGDCWRVVKVPFEEIVRIQDEGLMVIVDSCPRGPEPDDELVEERGGYRLYRERKMADVIAELRWYVESQLPGPVVEAWAETLSPEDYAKAQAHFTQLLENLRKAFGPLREAIQEIGHAAARAAKAFEDVPKQEPEREEEPCSG